MSTTVRRRTAMFVLALSILGGGAALVLNTALHAPTADGGLPGGVPITIKPPITLEPPITIEPPITRPPITRPPITRPPITIEPPITRPPFTRPPITIEPPTIIPVN